MFNLLIGGAAGQGIDTVSGVFETYLKENGFSVFATRDLMSRVRGGHNFTTLRISKKPVHTHDFEVDGILALNQETIDAHTGDLRENGFILADKEFTCDDDRFIPLPMDEIAEEIGNPLVASSVALGVLLRIFDFDLENASALFGETMKESIVDINVEAAQKGFDLLSDEDVQTYRDVIGGTGRGGLETNVPVDEKEYDYRDHIVINANQAIALGALSAGLTYYAAYPMSPATSIMEYLASIKAGANIVVEQAEDELGAMNMAVGASYAGAVSMTGTSGGGFALMIESLAQAGMTETPVVVADAMRPGPVTGLPTRTEQGDLNMAIYAGNGQVQKMVIAVKNHEDAFYQANRAHHIAQKYQMPVILLTDQYLSDGTATVPAFDLDKVTPVYTSQSPEEALAYREDYERGDKKTGEQTEKDLSESEYKRYRVTESGISPRLLPGNPYAFVSADTDEHDEYGFITEASDVRIEQMDKRNRKMTTLVESGDLQEPEVYGHKEGDIVLLAWGSLEGAVKEAVDELYYDDGLPVKALIFGDVWPLPGMALEDHARNARVVINVEQNPDGQLGGLIQKEKGIGTTASILKYDGRALSSTEIRNQVKEILEDC